MPVDMMIVDEDAGEGRVPGYENGIGVFAEPFLLKEDMVHMMGERKRLFVRARLDKLNEFRDPLGPRVRVIMSDRLNSK